jgi:hypothetical protein
MSLGWRGPIVAWAFLLSGTVALTQTAPLGDWLSVPPGKGGLLLAIDVHVSSVEVLAEYDPNEPPKQLFSVKWSQELPSFVTKFYLAAGEHRFRLQGPLSSVSVITKSGALAVLRLSPIVKDGSGVGVQAIVTPEPNADTISLLNQMRQKGAFLLSTPIASRTNTFLVNTEPPWPIPPRPPPPKQ